MEDNDKTAEQVLSDLTGIPVYRMKDDHGEYVTKSGAIKAMQEYASQQTASLTEQVKEWREHAERY